MTFPAPDFKDFEDYQYLQNYEDFGDGRVSNNTLLESHDVSYYVNNIAPTELVTSFTTPNASFPQGEYRPVHEINRGQSTMTLAEGSGLGNVNAESLQTPPPISDLILDALTLADARNCDACSYSFNESNSPEVFAECGHMVCKSCYIWCFDLSKGRCPHCNAGPVLKPAQVNVGDLDPSTSPPMPTFYSRAMGTLQNNNDNITLSFPERVEFILNKEEPITPGSPVKGMFRYSITANTVAVKVDADKSLTDALDFLKDLPINEIPVPVVEAKEVTTIPSKPAFLYPTMSEEYVREKQTKQLQSQQKPQFQQPQPPRKKVRRVTKPEAANGGQHFPTILIGTQGQIKRAVKRQTQQPEYNNAQSQGQILQTAKASTSTGYGQNGRQVQFMQVIPQQMRRRVVLLPNFSKLPKFNIRPNNGNHAESS